MRDFTKDSRGKKIKAVECTECGYTTAKMNYSDQVDRSDYKTARVEGTLGHYGPNGNGYNYWCPKDEHRMIIVDNIYSALDNFFGQ